MQPNHFAYCQKIIHHRRILFVCAALAVCFALPMQAVRTQPVPVAPLDAPDFDRAAFDGYFRAAQQSNSQAGWEEIVRDGKIALMADWELAADLKIEEQVVGATRSDAYINNPGYIDYLRKTLLLEKEKAFAEWELAADVAIQNERLPFLEQLASEQTTRADAGLDRDLRRGDRDAGQGDADAVNRTSENWSARYRKAIADGLAAYDAALENAQAEHDTIVASLDAAEARFQENLRTIEGYEQIVRDNIRTSVGGMRTYLETNGLFYDEDDQLNDAGLELQDLIASVENGLNNDVPLSQLATEMRDYMDRQKEQAELTQQEWAADISGHRDMAAFNVSLNGEGESAIHNITEIIALHDLHTYGLAAGMHDVIRARSGETRNITSVSADGVAWSSNYAPCPLTYSSGRSGESYSSAGSGSLTFDATCIGGAFSVPVWVTEAHSEHEMRLTISYDWHDPIAEDNANTWQGYVDALAPVLAEWENDIVPAIGTWEAQVELFRADHAAWQEDAAEQRARADAELAARTSAINADRSRWLARMESSYRRGELQWQNLQVTAQSNAEAMLAAPTAKARASADNSVPAFAAASASASAAASVPVSAASPALPDFSLLANFSSEYQTSLGGMQNTALASAMNEQARDSQADASHELEALAESVGFETDVLDDGTIRATRRIASGRARLREGGDATNVNDYEAEQTDQVLDFAAPQAVRLAETGNLFNHWDTAQVQDDFAANSQDFGASMQAKFDESTEMLETANEFATHRQEMFQQNALAQASEAQMLRSIAQSMLGGANFQQALEAYMQDQVDGAVFSEISALTGGDGLMSSVLRGLYLGMNTQQIIMDTATEAFTTMIAQATGLPSGLVYGFVNTRVRSAFRPNRDNSFVEAVLTDPLYMSINMAQSAIDLSVGAVYNTVTGRPTFPTYSYQDGAIITENSGTANWHSDTNQGDGFAIGPFIYVENNPDQALMDHEMAHVDQYYDLGPYRLASMATGPDSYDVEHDADNRAGTYSYEQRIAREMGLLTANFAEELRRIKHDPNLTLTEKYTARRAAYERVVAKINNFLLYCYTYGDNCHGTVIDKAQLVIKHLYESPALEPNSSTSMVNP